MLPLDILGARPIGRRSFQRLAVTLAADGLIAGACSGGAATIDDPTDILVRSYEAMQDVETFRVDVALEGEAPLGLTEGLEIFGQEVPSLEPGTGGTAGTIDLDGTTIVAEIDKPAEAFRVQFAAPALLDVSGEIIAVDDVVYVQASILGDEYFRMEPEDEATPSPEPTASVDPAAVLREALADLATPPEKLADEACGDTDCYHVRLVIDPEDLPDDEELPSMLPTETGPATVDVWVRKSDLRVSQVIVTSDAGAGEASATVVFSNYDADLTIEAPPADQVTDEPLELPDLGG
jgi:hypothetical protein